MTELGYSAERIAELHTAKAVGVWAPGEPLISGPRRFIGYKNPADQAPAQPAATATAAE